MSRETLEWLDENVLVGFTDKRGPAWHYRKGTTNHYENEIPVEDVKRRLFDRIVPVERELFVTGETGRVLAVRNHKAIYNGDDLFGIFTDGYRVHGYEDWLLANVDTLIGQDLRIGSAGLLEKGAIGWVQIEVPENIRTPEGVEFRPNLTAVTSLNGKYATTYKRMIQNVVCDNTLRAGMGEQGLEWRMRHSSGSLTRLAEARQALALEAVTEAISAFEDEVRELTSITVSDFEFDRFLELAVPMPTDEGRGKTLATTKRNAVRNLYDYDPRVTIWRATAFGVLQAMNTYAHHVQTVKGTAGNKAMENAVRAERNMSNALSGRTATADKQVIEQLMTIKA